MTSKTVEIVPPFHHQGNGIPFAATRWPDFGDRPALGRPFGQFFHTRTLPPPFPKVCVRQLLVGHSTGRIWWGDDTHELASVEQQFMAQPAIFVVGLAIWPTNLRNQCHLKECSWGVDRGVNGELLLFGMCITPQTTPLWCLTCRRGLSQMTQHTNAASNSSARVEIPYTTTLVPGCIRLAPPLPLSSAPQGAVLLTPPIPSYRCHSGQVRAARGTRPWTSGTNSSPRRIGTLLCRHVAGFYSAVDTTLPTYGGDQAGG